MLTCWIVDDLNFMQEAADKGHKNTVQADPRIYIHVHVVLHRHNNHSRGLVQDLSVNRPQLGELQTQATKEMIKYKYEGDSKFGRVCC